MLKENSPLGKEAKLLLLKILKQGYVTPQQTQELAKAIEMPSINIEIIDKTKDVEL